MYKEIWKTETLIGNKRVKNRIVFPPIGGNWADSNGYATEKIFDFYKRIAEGGCGMIIVEGTAISPDGKSASNSLCLYDKKHIEGLKKITGIIKREDCFCSLQLAHVGGQGNPNFTGHEPIAPSFYDCRETGFKAREVSIEEIAKISADYIRSAKMAEEAGFDAVELHLAHGLLLHEFLSMHFNKRNDKYGGSLENRTRLVVEIIRGIKQETRLILGARISGEDYVDDGINYKQNKEILPILENEGVNYFNITAGIFSTSKLKHEAMASGEFFRYSRETKGIVTKPVIGVGKILDILAAEEHLKDNDCDLVAIGRGLIADTAMIRKTLVGIAFNKCTECGECQYLRHGKKNMSCPVGDI